MTKLAYTAALLGELRRQVTNQVSRHAIVAACAVGGEAGSTLKDIADRLGDPDPNCLSTQTGSYADQGLLHVVHGTKPRRYTVAPLGIQLLAPLIKAHPVPA